MSDHPPIDLTYIGRALERLTSEVMTLRDDITVLSAIVMRIDGTLTGLVQEIRATQAAE